MKLMRIGEVGAERPVIRLDDDTYIDVSDAAGDFDEAFFGGDGLAALRPLVQQRQAAGQVERFAGERIGAPFGRPHRADPVQQVAEHPHRAQ